MDLVIALSLVTVWMWGDARRRGRSAIPYVLMTLALGSAGPLLDLLTREEEAEPAPARATRVPARA
jgi:hypothetical protein